MKQPKPYLLNILTGIEAIESYRPETEEMFVRDPKSQDAILMRLQDIGENLLHIRDMFPDFWDTHSTDAWNKAIGLRNIISHGYLEVDLTIIWTLINKNFPTFKQSIERLI